MEDGQIGTGAAGWVDGMSRGVKQAWAVYACAYASVWADGGKSMRPV